MKDLISFKGKNPSSQYNLNYLYNEGKVFIMDNHLAATWCWLQKIDPLKNYNFFHIDQHNDLLESQLDLWIDELNKQNIDLKTISINDFLDLKYFDSSFNQKIQLFSWENYLPIFYRRYPKTISKFFFATHQYIVKNKNISISEIGIWDLQHSLSQRLNYENNNNWIVNLDLDYFFSKKDYEDEIRFQFLTDEYILEIMGQLKNSMDRIEVLTIALSPEMCGGWDNSIRILHLIAKYLNIKIQNSSIAP